MCVLAVVLVLILAALAAASAQLRCVDAAREAARLIARGERDRAAEAVSHIAPQGAVLSVQVDGDAVITEVVSKSVALLPNVHVSGSAFAVLESEVDGRSNSGS